MADQYREYLCNLHRVAFMLIAFLAINPALLLAADKDVYIVYMGSARGKSAPQHASNHLQMLSSVLGESGGMDQLEVSSSLLYSYVNGFSGFAAHLSEEEAAAMSAKPGVVSVFKDPVMELHTTRSWDFLEEELLQGNFPKSRTLSSNVTKTTTDDGAYDVIVGLLDTGVWPESLSFSDNELGPIPSRWKGICMEGVNFNASHCNRKLIGARYYSRYDGTPRDAAGHGTHTASTAVGSEVPGSGYFGLATGTAKGGSPLSRLAVYRVCSSYGCTGSAILAGFDDAIADGVDVLSVSLGGSPGRNPGFLEDPIGIGSFHAVEAGITVVCSAGNNGPTGSTVVNTAPWILTVAATTIDRDYESDLIIGANGGKAIKGEAINFSNLDRSPVYSMIEGGSAAANDSTYEGASSCLPSSLDASKVRGKIVVCRNSFSNVYPTQVKASVLKNMGAIGIVFINDVMRKMAFEYREIPVTEISSADGVEVLAYINSTNDPVATILPTVSSLRYKPAPVVAFFSSKGPSADTRNILKPDIGAPGVNILAAYIPMNLSTNSYEPKEQLGEGTTMFRLLSGTSMSCPHVAGVAASVKSFYSSFSPAAIRSAIMTSATNMDNTQAQTTTDMGTVATPYHYGSGQLNPTGAVEPGLVYDASMDDYYLFLCNYGYTSETITKMTGNFKTYECSPSANRDLISDLNYPSIAVTSVDGQLRTVKRRLTSVEDGVSDYTVLVISPDEIQVIVEPSTLHFTKAMETLEYQVSFKLTTHTDPPTGDLFGALVWSDGKRVVRTPFVVIK